MRIIVTCGPAFEPIDEVRRLTNFSTGELGVLLANRLGREGHQVICFKGVGATTSREVTSGFTAFSTNDDLQRKLEQVERREEIGAVFHTAALCDFKVAGVTGGPDAAIEGRKISSRAGELLLRLEPARKVIRELRALFPGSRIVGWKYELDGGREEAIARAVRQIEENQTDAAVANGRAYGEGFGVCGRLGLRQHLAGKRELCDWFADWLTAEK